MVAISNTMTNTSGPRITWNDFPWKTCSLRSTIAIQIHIAGRSWTSVRRQFVNSSFRPWNSMTNAPTTSASGAKIRGGRRRVRTASSTIASSPSRIASMSRRTCAAREARRELLGGSVALVTASATSCSSTGPSTGMLHARTDSQPLGTARRAYAPSRGSHITPFGRRSDGDSHLVEISHDDVGAVRAEVVAVAPAVNADDETKVSRAPGFHARDRVLHDDTPLRCRAETSGGFDEHVGRRLSGKTEMLELDPIDAHRKEVGDARGVEYAPCVSACGNDGGRHTVCVEVAYERNRRREGVHALCLHG